MGDLIIKPESGGSIKLQNNAGTNALVSDNSGNITVGVALGVTGSVTLAGSANNLGTVTAGNLSHADIVYPSGHILQIQTAHVYTQQSIVNTTADIASKTFNRIKGTSKFILNSTITLGMKTSQANQDGADPVLLWRINSTNYSSLGGVRNTDGWYHSTVPSWYMEGSNYVGSYEIYQYSMTEEITSYSSGSDGDSITFKVAGKSGSLGMYVNQPVDGGATNGSASYITIMEVIA